MPQCGKCPGGITDVLGHTAGQVCEQLQGCCCQERLARDICQLGKRPACMTDVMHIITVMLLADKPQTVPKELSKAHVSIAKNELRRIIQQ